MDKESKFKNWKSFLAFFLFIGIYAYTVVKGEKPETIETTGYIALYAMAFVMVRNERLASVIETVNEVIKSKFSKE